MPESASIDAAVALLRGRKLVVLCGAGCSTESGIPDYRGPGTRARARQPIQGRAFIDSVQVRRRYWARAMIGWPRFAAARPNPAHRALADLEAAGLAIGLITQNVDRLHHAAGSRNVVELHGALARVRCLRCGASYERDEVQRWMEHENAGFGRSGPLGAMAPDGDAELSESWIAEFVAPVCRACEGPLKPDVVFFGETVPGAVVEAAYGMLDRADALVVVGSSLAVFSGYRFVRAAAKRGQPIAILNLGETRGDALASVRVEATLGHALPALVSGLTAGSTSLSFE